MQKSAFIPWNGLQEMSPDQMQQNAQALYDRMKQRRSIRAYSDRPVPRSVVQHCIAVAGTAPSGANKQPWHFVVVTDPERKQAMRAASEQCEREFYGKIQDTQWNEDLKPLGVDTHKPFLTEAPCLVVIFAQRYALDSEGKTEKHYYVSESVGLAAGFFLTAVHQAGLASLVYTPAPMTFLNDLLDRPANERAFCLCPVGYPAPQAMVPDQTRKPVDEIVTWY